MSFSAYCFVFLSVDTYTFTLACFYESMHIVQTSGRSMLVKTRGFMKYGLQLRQSAPATTVNVNSTLKNVCLGCEEG